MRNYSQYQAEDFVNDPDFIRWVFEKNAADDAFWQQWLEQHPYKQAEVEDARLLLRSFKIEEAIPEPAIIDQEIATILQSTQKKQSKGIYAVMSRWKYAAALIGIIAGGALTYSILRSPGNKPNLSQKYLPDVTDQIAEEVNADQQYKSIQLEDGSTVRLSPGSIVRYSRNWSAENTRDIYLSGEAFFDVVKNPDKPFRVFSHELVVKVLGTSFNIKGGEKDNQISVVVRSGKVSVYDNENEKEKDGINSQVLTGMVLTPNQEAVYLRSEHKFQKILTEHPILIHPKEISNNFQYEDMPVEQVLEELRKAFGIDFAYDKDVIKNCRITADLSNESIYKKLDLICRAMDAKYDVIDGLVTIQARPCE